MFLIAYAKMQIACLIILLYIALNYFYECHKYGRQSTQSFYDEILGISIATVILDGISACTVNFPDVIPKWFNLLVHAGFFIGLNTFIFLLFRYLRKGIRKQKQSLQTKIFLYLPWGISNILILLFIPFLHFRTGIWTDYSMGLSAQTCFIVGFIYILECVYELHHAWRYIGMSKRISLLTFIAVLAVVCSIQAICPETLITSLGITIVTIGIYLNLENPAFDELRRNYDAMVVGFADLVENRDENTGGHIKRTSEYVRIIVKQLRDRRVYEERITVDFTENVIKAAPLHDIGKIATPDAILTKPGKLTDEEYEIMKQHVIKGSEMLEGVLRNMNDKDYKEIAYEVCRYHHEKWNGKGYPEGLANYAIPLSARIMAVADVFDAISQKRCYRDAMPLDKCFQIIAEGSGKDFDPEVVNAFFAVREEAERICMEYREK